MIIGARRQSDLNVCGGIIGIIRGGEAALRDMRDARAEHSQRLKNV